MTLKSVRANSAIIALLLTVTFLFLASLHPTRVSAAEIQTTGSLTVTKIVATGGDASPSDFLIHVTQEGEVSGSPQPGSSEGTTYSSLLAGTYNVSESGEFQNYTATFTGDCNSDGYVTVSSDANATCTITNTYVPPTPTSSDIALTKTVDNATPNIGATVTYTLTAIDTGADATGVVVQDTLPANVTFVSTSTSDTIGVYDSTTGIWTIGALGSTTSAVLHIMATVNAGLGNGTVINNTASVIAGDTSDQSENNSASASATVTIPTTGGGSSTPPPAPIGNGPIVGSFGGGGGSGPVAPQPTGVVLGASTTTIPSLPPSSPDYSSCSAYLTAFIGTGENNDPTQVMRLQTFLNTYEGATLTVNGIYDAPTLAATMAFQKKYGTDILHPWGIGAPTGYVYLTTRREINEIYCHFTQNFPLSPNEQAIITAALTGGSGGGHTGSSGTPSQTAAIAVTDMGTSTDSDSSMSSSSPVTGNPITNFFKNLFGN